MDKVLYQERLYDHFKHPRHKGTLACPDFESGMYNPSCGDAIFFQGSVENNMLKAIAFEGKGCVISLGTASMLSEHVVGKSLDTILALTKDDIGTLIALELGPTRLRCALLALEALQSGIKQYTKQG